MSIQSSRWEPVKELFHEVLARDPAERAQFLRAACGSDDELHDEVQSLLASHETRSCLIDKPAVFYSFARNEPPSATPWIGRRVGAYRITEEIGRGGMSEVYKAVRADDQYEKQVAVKVLRQGYGINPLLRRFKRERQLLAGLDHPNIAHLLDAGSTEDGLPFLVMDYVPGRHLDDYCDRRQLSLAGRLELFRTLCSAVQYVHQRLMIHGDLKCTNVLVTEDGTLKLLDFGVAKIVNSGNGADHAMNVTGLLAMTPAYASPEQLRGENLTTASDVYSLGVLLYRLLTGEVPHRPASSAPHEFAGQICNDDPERPSVVVKRRKTAEMRAGSSLHRQLRGDLDNIVGMALRKEPRQRYSSVEQLSDDVRRSLEGRPVLAREQTVGYRLRKFVARHRVAVGAAALVVVSLVAGVAATSWQAHIAGIQRARAERHFNEVLELADSLMFEVHGAIENLPGATGARQLLIEKSLHYLDGLSGENEATPSVKRELAAAYEKLADIQGGFRSANLGDARSALRGYRKALAIRETVLSDTPRDKDLLRDVMRNNGKLSDLSLNNNDLVGALAYAQQAVRIASKLHEEDPADPANERNLANALLNLGMHQSRAGQSPDGVRNMHAAISLYEGRLSAQTDDQRTRRNAALAYSRLGQALLDLRQYQEAIGALRQAFHTLQPLLDAGSPNSDLEKIAAYVHLDTGKALLRSNHDMEAEEEDRTALGTLRALVDSDPKNAEARLDLATALSEFSDVDLAQGRDEHARLDLRNALALLEDLPDAHADQLTPARTLVATTQFKLGKIGARLAHRATSPTARFAELRESNQWLNRSLPVLLAAEENMLYRADVAGNAAEARQLSARSSAQMEGGTR